MNLLELAMPNSEEFKVRKRLSSQKHRERNRVAINEKSRLANAFRRQNPILRAKANASSVASITKRRLKDPFFAFKESIKTLIIMSIRARGWSKQTKTAQLLGCSFEELKLHIEKQFTQGMTWENRGEWEIDHIIPCARATTPTEFEKLQHYTNLQPLWAVDNMKKGSK